MGRYTHSPDWLTTILLLSLGLFGLFLLSTINIGLFWQQLGFLVIGVVLLIIFSRIDYALYHWFAPIGYVLSLLFILLSYAGPEIRGATRWIMIFGVQLQPSELVKPFILLALSRFLIQYSPRKVTNLPLLLLLFFLPFILVFKQPDLGTSLVYLSSFLLMLWTAGLPVLVPVIAVPTMLLAAPGVWRVLADYQKARILTFLNPGLDPGGAGYNALQAVIAVGSGLWFGRGLGFGTQSHLRFLPESHTDFIFASLIEELGFVGGAVLLGMYAILVWRILRRILRSEFADLFTYFYSVGLFALVLTQIFINAGMNIGLLPITGITLPLVSYGGSSIFSLCISFGILQSLRARARDPLS